MFNVAATIRLDNRMYLSRMNKHLNYIIAAFAIAAASATVWTTVTGSIE